MVIGVLLVASQVQRKGINYKLCEFILMSKDLKSFLKAVENEIVYVKHPVDQRYELNAYVDAYEKLKKYPVLYFNNVNGKVVVTNLFASIFRMGKALDCDKCDIPSIANKFFELSQKELNPKEVPDSNFDINTEDLSGLPHIVHNELDGGPYIDSGLAILKDPDTGALNMGIYRHQIFDDKHLGILTDPGHDAQYIIEKYKQMGKPVPITISIGHHPAVYFAAVSRPKGIGGELNMAGGFLQEPLEITYSNDLDLPYLTRSEIVIEGLIEDPSYLVKEGPFGEWPKYYSGTQMTPVITVKRVRSRHDSVYLDIAAAYRDHLNLGVNLPHLAAVYNYVKSVSPYVKNIRFGYDFAPLLYIQIKKVNEGDAKRAALAALSSEIAIRVVIVVDEDVDIYNDEEVMWAVLTRASRETSFTIIPEVIGNILNPANYSIEGSPRTLDNKIIIDATKPISKFPPVARAPQHLVSKILNELNA
jgi:2,5-furandicarboxylate decarboxylase 1